MEGIGTYISVVGLSSLFAGDFVIILMAIIFDVAKITSVTFLYQNWKDVSRPMKYYMTVAVLILMLITSGGAFGYLSAAFQRSVQPNVEAALKVDSFAAQQSDLLVEKKQLTDLKLSINNQIAAVTASDKARRLITSLKPELDQTNKRLAVLNAQIDDMRAKSLAAKTDNLEKDVHTGPIIYVSKAFGLSVEDVSKYIILIIVSVFDTLAVVLLLAANFLIKAGKKAEEAIPEPEPEVVPEPEPEPLPEPVKPNIFVHENTVLEPVVHLEQPEPPPPLEVPTEPSKPLYSVTDSIPAVDVTAPETSYSGSPQTDFIHEPLPVTLENGGMVLK